MTVVIADTSPLNYLVLIGQVEILRCLYNKVLVPPEVLVELRDSSAPSPVLDWIHSQPEWLEVRAITRHPNEAALQHIGPGERAAILLAQQEADALLLIDDASGRAEADRCRIRCTGTLGILRIAALRRLLDLPSALTRLAQTNFRVSRSLIDELMAEDSERKRHISE